MIFFNSYTKRFYTLLNFLFFTNAIDHSFLVPNFNGQFLLETFFKLLQISDDYLNNTCVLFVSG